jgi:hypothetical protein
MWPLKRRSLWQIKNALTFHASAQFLTGKNTAANPVRIVAPVI